MKKNTTYLLASAVIFAALSFQKSGDFKIEKYFAKNGHKFSAGPPTGQTGAPGETNCTSCHVGTALSGASENTFILLSGLTPVTSYVPGQTYTATLTMGSNPAKKGFEATAFGTSNVMAGTFAGQAGITAVTTSGATNYASQTATSNTNAVSTWVWAWTAPAVDAGDVTFYVATNKTNNSGTNAGDEIYLSQHVITSTLSLEENNQFETNFKAGYSSSNNTLNFGFNSLTSGELTVNIVDLNGKSVFFNNLGASQIGANKQNMVLPAEIKNGMYIVNVLVDNKAMAAKILIQK